MICYVKDERKTRLEFRHLGRIRAALRWSAASCDVGSSKGFSRDLQDTISRLLLLGHVFIPLHKAFSLSISTKMVNCCVPGCTNYSAKTVDVSYHKIPSDKQRRKAWLDRIRRSNMPQVQYSYVCSDHFLPSCFQSDLRSQITTQKCKRRLKEDAIPSEFKYSPEAKKPRLSSENRLDRRRHQEVSSLYCILCCYELFFAKVPSPKKIMLGYSAECYAPQCFY